MVKDKIFKLDCLLIEGGFATIRTRNWGVIMNPPEPHSSASPASENEDSPVGCVRRGRLEHKHIAGRFTLIQITNFSLSIFSCRTLFGRGLPGHGLPWCNLIEHCLPGRDLPGQDLPGRNLTEHACLGEAYLDKVIPCMACLSVTCLGEACLGIT